MSVKTAATLMCNSASTCLPLALFLRSYIRICSGILTESDQISRDENTTCPETTIPQGTLQGINMVTRYKRTVSGFIGIPYAEPPVGDLRCPTTLESVSTTTWVPYSSDNNYLQIGNGSDTALETKYDLLLERMQFWDELTKATAASDEFLNSPHVLC